MTDGLRWELARRLTKASFSLSICEWPLADAGAGTGLGVLFGAMTLCARCMRPGGARGPPGRWGDALSCTGRGSGAGGAGGEANTRLLMSLFGGASAPRSRLVLVLRPIDAKKPPPPKPVRLLELRTEGDPTPIDCLEER